MDTSLKCTQADASMHTHLASALVLKAGKKDSNSEINYQQFQAPTLRSKSEL